MRTAALFCLLLVAAPASAGGGPRRRDPAAQACIDSVRPLIHDLVEAWAEGDRFDKLAAWAKGRPISCCQAMFIISAVWRESSRMLQALRILAPQIADRNNVDMIVSIFALQEDREAARALVLR